MWDLAPRNVMVWLTLDLSSLDWRKIEPTETRASRNQQAKQVMRLRTLFQKLSGGYDVHKRHLIPVILQENNLHSHATQCEDRQLNLHRMSIKWFSYLHVLN